MSYIRLLCISLVLLLSGCGEDVVIDSPQHTALSVFKAIYIESDMDKAYPHLSEPLVKRMKHHRIASQVQRNVFGLSLTDVSLSIGDVEGNFFQKADNAVNIEIRLEGNYGATLVREARKVQLKHINDQWIVVKLFEDKFKNNM